jgi:hypothetical protein
MFMRLKALIPFFSLGILLVDNEVLVAQVGIGTTTPHASAKLEIAASDKGFLPPRVALTGTDDAATVASPATGLLVYNTATAGASGKEVTPGLYTWNGTVWERLSANNPNGQDIGYVVGWGSSSTPPDYLLPLSGGTFNWSDYPDFKTLHTDFPSAFVASSTATTFTLANLNTDGRFLRGSATPGVNQAMATAAPTTTAFAAATAGAHTHSVDPAAVTSSSDGSHAHTVDPVAVTSSSNGNHEHTYSDAYFAENRSIAGNNKYGTSANTDTDNNFIWRTNADSYSNNKELINTSTTGSHTHTVDVASTTSSADGTHSHTVDVAATTSTSNGDHTHTITGGDTETRPINTSVVWCLKVKSTSTSGAVSINSGATSAINGLTLSNNAVELGGTLTKATTIQSGGNALILGGSAQLGVGKTPSQAVDVSGNIAATGNISAGGNATVTGNITATGYIRSSSSGSVLKVTLLDETDLGKSATTSLSGDGTEYTVVSYTYTPVSNASVLIINYDANYVVPGNHGGTDDEVTTRLKAAGNTLQTKAQRWAKPTAAGVETRHPGLFPLKGKYVNGSTSAVTITVTAQRTSGDDGINVLADMTLQITEIAQ